MPCSLCYNLRMPSPDWTRVSTSTGYPVVFCPDHPRAWSTGYVYVHVLVAEEKLGRYLREGEIVHHRDGNRFNYAANNIEITTRPEHGRIHARSSAQVTLICAKCGAEFQRLRRRTTLTKPAFCSKACAAARPIRHGTATGYGRGCRCDTCRKAQADRQRRRRNKPL